MKCEEIIPSMIVGSVEDVDYVQQVPSKVAATKTTGQPCAGPYPIMFTLKRAPSNSTREIMVVSKRKVSISGPARGKTREENADKFPGGRETSARAQSGSKSHCKTWATSPMH